MVKLENERQRKYEELESRIGNTYLVPFIGEVPNGNKIWIKREDENPYGSHYDRVYVDLFRHFEATGKIQPGDKVIETSSGTAGASYAGIGQSLGFDCHLAIPEGVDEAVIDVIRSYGATFHFTPEQDYIAGFPEFLKTFQPWNKGFAFLSHSMERVGSAYLNNETTLVSLGGIAREALEQTEVDYFIGAVGNGSSVLGAARVFGDAARLISFESFQSAVVYDKMHPGDYEAQYGIKPGSLPKHKLRGTSFHGIDFPHINTLVQEGRIDEARLLSDTQVDRNYAAATGRHDTEELIHWDRVFKGHEDLGRTGRAGIAVALDLAERVEGKNILIVAYDKANRYDY